MASGRLIEFANRNRTEAEVRAAQPEMPRIAVRIDKVNRVAMPDGSLLFQPLVRRPHLRNSMTTFEAFVRELEALTADGRSVTLTGLRIGDRPKPATTIPLRAEPDARPCDSERSE